MRVQMLPTIKGGFTLVLVTYNRCTLLEKCLQSILENENINFLRLLYVVDNNSSDNTKELILSYSKRYSQIKYIHLNENLGGAGGFEFGLKMARNEGGEWFGLLDDDIVLDAHCLSTLFRLTDRFQCMSAVRENLDESLAEYSALRFDFSNPFRLNIKVTSIAKEYKKRDAMPESIEIHGAAFEGLFLNKSVIDKVGYPHREFFIFGDDSDYCIRIRRNNFAIRAIRDAKIIRQLEYHSKQENKVKRYFRWRNFFVLHFLYGENIFVRCKPYLFSFVLLIANLFNKNKIPSLRLLSDARKTYRILKTKQ